MKQKELIFLKGLPASGKSSYAKEVMEKLPNKYKRVNKDDLRSAIDFSVYNKNNEKFINNLEEHIIKEAFRSGYSVIWDNTHIIQKHEQRAKRIIDELKKENINISLKVLFFNNYTLDELIKRDLQRSNSVGEKVIKDMHNKLFGNIKKPKNYVERDKNLIDAIIFDIDGTLALMDDRGPFDYDKVDTDLVHKPIEELHSMLHKFYHVIIVSGRDSICMDKTKKWLNENQIEYDKLYMRKQGDSRKDSIIKEEIYNDHIKGKYNVSWVFDDRNQTVDKWRELGLCCLQVADGNF